MTDTVISPATLKAYVEQFNADDEELYANIPNEDAFAFLEENIPLFECPDQDFERTYYFRWWTYRKHVKRTDDGYVITEFLPDVPWSRKHNVISCPADHHYYEGRWLHKPQYLDDYSYFYLRKGGDPRHYSFWIAYAFYARHKVTPDSALLIDLLPDLLENYEAWETGWVNDRQKVDRRDNGLFWQFDGADGGELSIGGHGFRPTLNSFMYGDAKAIAATQSRPNDLRRKRPPSSGWSKKSSGTKMRNSSRSYRTKARRLRMYANSTATHHGISISLIQVMKQDGKN